jgi:hypothetical protein
MKNVYEVLRQKEQLLERTQREIEALQLVTPLLINKDDCRNVQRQKEQVRDRAHTEIDALNLVAPLLVDKEEAKAAGAGASTVAEGPEQPKDLKDALKRWP